MCKPIFDFRSSLDQVLLLNFLPEVELQTFTSRFPAMISAARLGYVETMMAIQTTMEPELTGNTWSCSLIWKSRAMLLNGYYLYRLRQTEPITFNGLYIQLPGQLLDLSGIPFKEAE